MKLRNRGVTLVELMIVIVVIAVLAALAITRYRSATIKTKISEAVIFMRYLQNLSYAYYVQHGVLPSQDGTFLYIYDSNPNATVFGSNPWFQEFTKNIDRRLRDMGYERPYGQQRFWYLAGWGVGDVSTLRVWAYPKREGDWQNFPEEEIDNSLRDIIITIDNDGQVYVWGATGVQTW